MTVTSRGGGRDQACAFGDEAKALDVAQVLPVQDSSDQSPNWRRRFRADVPSVLADLRLVASPADLTEMRGNR